MFIHNRSGYESYFPRRNNLKEYTLRNVGAKTYDETPCAAVT